MLTCPLPQDLKSYHFTHIFDTRNTLEPFEHVNLLKSLHCPAAQTPLQWLQIFHTSAASEFESYPQVIDVH